MIKSVKREENFQDDIQGQLWVREWIISNTVSHQICVRPMETLLLQDNHPLQKERETIFYR